MPRRQPSATASARPRAARRTSRTAIAVAIVTSLACSASTSARASAGWRLPVDGAVVGGFRVTPGAPFAAGQRRGIDLRASPGTAVRGACSGRVTFAGRVPRFGSGVTVRCGTGPWVATHLGLSATAIAAGQAVIAGATVVGHLGATGLLRLGARRDGHRFGYVDPLELIEETGPRPVLAPPPGRVLPRGRDGGPRPARRPIAVPWPARTSPAGEPATVPVLGWLGLALLACAAPLTLAAGLRVRRYHRRTVAAGRRAAHR